MELGHSVVIRECGGRAIRVGSLEDSVQKLANLAKLAVPRTAMFGWLTRSNAVNI